MEDKEIIKALECCCDELHCCSVCPYFLQDKENDFCREDMNKDALDLINRQQAEIKEWKRVVETWLMQHEKDKAEIERLNKAIDNYEDCLEKIETIKAKAIKEFAERLKDYGTLPDLPWDIWKTFADNIDNLAKEMVGDE
jgi:DNA repair exonuclease SbcCD ATPase subunit